MYTFVQKVSRYEFSPTLIVTSEMEEGSRVVSEGYKFDTTF